MKYAACILALSVFGVVQSLYETIVNINSIRKMAKFECNVQVKRIISGEAKFIHVSSQNLVPGDVLVVPTNTLMPCDMVLFTGSCIVNESMLTGESVPVIKNALLPTNHVYDP